MAELLASYSNSSGGDLSKSQKNTEPVTPIDDEMGNVSNSVPLHYETMEKETEATPSCCSRPGCDQPATCKCPDCDIEPYCGPLCQTAHSSHHKESCEGLLLNVGMNHLDKAKKAYGGRNFQEMLRYSDLAFTKFNSMKKRPLEAISETMAVRCQALKFLGHHADALLCAKSMYNLWAIARGPAHLHTIDAAFYLVESSLFNREFVDAEFFAQTLWKMIQHDNLVDNFPADKRQKYVANAAQMLAQATYQLAESGGIPLEELKKAEELAVARARQSVEINTQEYGAESEHVALSMGTLSDVLDYFSDGNDDEVLLLNEQALTIHMRMYGKNSMNVGTCQFNLGSCFDRRANNARNVNDLDQCYDHLESAQSHYREAFQIFKAIDLVDNSHAAFENMTAVEDQLLRIAATRAVSLSSSGNPAKVWHE